MNPNKKSKLFLSVYLILSSLLVIDCLLFYFQRISFRGYYSDVVLFWMWFITSWIVITIFWKKIIAKLLLAGMLITLILSILPMMLPFYALLFSTTSLGLVIDRNLNEKYRAQIVGYSVMTHPWLEVIEKHGIIEKRILKIDDSALMNDTLNIKIRTANNITFKNETDTTLTLTLFHVGSQKTITFNKNTGSISAIENN